MKLPYATKISASVSGVVLALMLSAADHFGGSLEVVLTISGIIWFPVSIAVFVHGKQTINMKIESLLGKRSRTDVPKDITPRALIWFCSTLAAAWAFSLWLK